mmetsp:Transcript_15776/g.22857  ORF Transcript_15776/g.22857 Transcript_15776/m.22857 type:complete len:246 (+) Transcript_15776:894-1631(+)
MRDSIHASIGDEGLGKLVAEGAINDSHIRGELVAEDRVLHAGVVRDDSEWRHFGRSAGGGGDADEFVDLGAELGERGGALPELDEARGGVFDVELRMLVDGADELACVHGGAASQTHHEIWFEGFASLDSAADSGHIRIRVDLVKDGDGESLVNESLPHTVHVPHGVHDLISYNDGPSIPGTVRILASHIRQCILEAVAVEVDLRRVLEPFRVLLTGGHSGDVKQVHRAHVVRHRRAGFGSYAQG